jgi:hypothetical protein
MSFATNSRLPEWSGNETTSLIFAFAPIGGKYGYTLRPLENISGRAWPMAGLSSDFRGGVQRQKNSGNVCVLIWWLRSQPFLTNGKGTNRITLLFYQQRN